MSDEESSPSPCVAFTYSTAGRARPTTIALIADITPREANDARNASDYGDVMNYLTNPWWRQNRTGATLERLRRMHLAPIISSPPRLVIPLPPHLCGQSPQPPSFMPPRRACNAGDGIHPVNQGYNSIGVGIRFHPQFDGLV